MDGGRLSDRQRADLAEADRTIGRSGLTITLSRSLIVRTLSALIVLFVAAHLLFSVNRYMVHASFFGADNLYVIFDLWDEVSIPSWYSTSLLLVSAALLAVIATAKRRTHDHYARHWTGLAIIFLALSIDDAANLHGHTSYRLKQVLETGGFFAYAWVIPAAIACGVLALAYRRFLADLPPPTRWRFLLAAGLFLTGALALEMIEARYDSQHGVENMPYRIMVAIEEGLEMIGTVLFISTLLGYLADLVNRLEIRVRA